MDSTLVALQIPLNPTRFIAMSHTKNEKKKTEIPTLARLLACKLS